ncbi:MAG: hypothetical protein L3J07_03995 [Candidatus Magasanikbacteria bacterium]|nr:hypothetical protein [Candidatus Magasanikbacteria bacterium]
MGKWKVLENIEMAVLKASEVFLCRQREKVAKSVCGLFVVMLDVELNFMKGHNGLHKFLKKENELVLNGVSFFLNADGLLSVNWKIHTNTHWQFIKPGEQALVNKNRLLVKTFFEKKEALEWSFGQVLSCNRQLQDDEAESADPQWVM